MDDPLPITARLAAHGISHHPAGDHTGQRILRNTAGGEIARCDVFGAVELLTDLDAPADHDHHTGFRAAFDREAV